MNRPRPAAFAANVRLELLAALLLTSWSVAQDARVPVSVPSYRDGLPSPRIDLTWNLSWCEDDRGVFRTQAHPSASGRGLRLQWQWFPQWPTAKGRRYDSSRIEFDGVLTALSVPEWGVVVAAVAGCETSPGRMRLERIELGPPEFDLQAREIRAGRELARRTLWESEEPGRNVIAQLARWPGEPGTRLIALMWDTPELRAFDMDTGAWSRLAAVRSFGEPGVLEERELTRTYHSLSVRNHRRHGYVLLLNTQRGCFPGKDDQLLMLADVDRDGTLDKGRILSEDDWGAEFNDPNAYVR